MRSPRSNVAAWAASACLAAAWAPAEVPVASQPDPWVARPRVVVMTDIANEPDDQMSLVRFLLYSNQWDVEGLVATTSTWMKSRVRPDVILSVLDPYEKVQPNLLRHAPGFPSAAALRAVVVPGQPGYGMDAVGEGRASPGAELILRAAERDDPRPLWVLAWGGTNTLAQALFTARATRSPARVEAIVAKLRVYAISDQDDAGPWLRREFPALRYVADPSTQNGEEYYLATWTGISGDRFYRNCDGADYSTFTDEWIDANVRGRGPLGALYPRPCCIHEGDTPSFLWLVDNGLGSAMSPAFGGWGGRYVWRQPHGETRPFWTHGGDSYPGNDSSRDTVVGADGKPHTSDQATIWRWRTAFQNDFAARLDWTIKDVGQANHNAKVVVNGRAGTEPLFLEARLGEPVVLDASGTTDPDGNGVTYSWFFYPEAGTGIPGQPVRVRRRPPAGGAGSPGGILSAPTGGPREPPPRVTIENASGPRATVVPNVEGIAHVILAVEDDGAPPLTAYRRAVLSMKAAPEGAPPPVGPASGTASRAPWQLAPDEVRALEEKVAATPADLELRRRLLGHYMTERTPEGQAARERHALWVIENAPESAIAGSPEAQLHRALEADAYEQGRSLWLAHLEARGADPRIVGNAAGFFLLAEPARARDLLQRGRELEPRDPRWSERLAHLDMLAARRPGPEARDAARRALEEFEHALSLTRDDRARYYSLADVAEAARLAGDDEKARTYADELLRRAQELSRDWNYGNAVHDGHRILGHVALNAGDVDLAKKHLLEAGPRPAPPSSTPSGPS